MLLRLFQAQGLHASARRGSPVVPRLRLAQENIGLVWAIRNIRRPCGGVARCIRGSAAPANRAGGSRIHPDHLFEFGAIDRHGEKIGKHVLADLISGQRSELAQEASARRLDATAKLLEHLAGKGTSADSLASILPPAA